MGTLRLMASAELQPKVLTGCMPKARFFHFGSERKESEPLDALLRRARSGALRQMLVDVCRPSTVNLWRRVRREVARIRNATTRDTAVLRESFVAFCRSHVPHYTATLPRGCEFTALPILTRGDLAEGFSGLIARSPGSSQLMSSDLAISRTTGSTGTPTTYLEDRSRASFYNQVQSAMMHEELELPRGGELFDFGLRAYRQPILERRLVPGAYLAWNFRPYRPGPLFEGEYAAMMAAGQPVLMYGHPSRLVKFAEIYRQSRFRYRIRHIISSFEQLTDAARTQLQEDFGCAVTSLYGTVEAGLIGWECSARAIHYNPAIHHIEIVDEHGLPVAPGTVGRLLATTLQARVMPLLRYETGDLAVSAEGQSCQCGKPTPFFAALQGRVTAQILTRGSVTFPAYRVLSFCEDLRLASLQLVQDAPGELTLITEPGASLDSNRLAEFKRRLELYLGEETTLSVQSTGAFRLAGTGKRNPFVGMTSTVST